MIKTYNTAWSFRWRYPSSSAFLYIIWWSFLLMVETEYETMYLGAAGHADIQKGLSKRQTKLYYYSHQ
jgi:hypothetical protein